MSTNDYKKFSFYKKNGGSPKDGYSKFDDKGEYFFTYNKSGKVLLISEGYVTAKSRDKGIESVKTNKRKKERYRFEKKSSGKWILKIVAGNGQEIARSEDKATEKAVWELGTLLSRAKFVKVAKVVEPKTKKAKEEEGGVVKSGLYKYNKAVKYIIKQSKNGKYYFTFRNADGVAILMNSNIRGFVSQKDAENGIKTLLTRSAAKKSYVIRQIKDGRYQYTLTDGKGTNIAKSFFFKTKQAMDKELALLLSSEVVSSSTKSKPTTTVKKSKISSVSSTKQAGISKKLEQRPTKQPRPVKKEEQSTAKQQSTSSSKPKESTTKIEASATSNKKANVEPIPQPNVADKSTASVEPTSTTSISSDGFHAFTEGGRHYFSYKKGDKTMFKSEGYVTKSAAEVQLKKIKSVVGNTENWKKGKTAKGKYYYYLVDENGAELAKSDNYSDIGNMVEDLSWINSKAKLAIVKAKEEITESSAKLSSTANELKEEVSKATSTAKEQVTDAMQFGKKEIEIETEDIYKERREKALMPQPERSGFNIWPFLIALLVIGLLASLFLMRGCGEETKTNVATAKKEVIKTKEATKERASQVTKKIKSTTSKAVDKAKKATKVTTDKAKEATRTTIDKAKDKVAKTTKEVKEATNKIVTKAKKEVEKVAKPVVPSVSSPSPTKSSTVPAGAKSKYSIEYHLRKCVYSYDCETGKLFRYTEPKFAKNSTRLNSTSKVSAKSIAKLMKEKPTMRLTIIGNNSAGENENSQSSGLSQARAKAFANAITAAGVSSSRIQTIGNSANNTVVEANDPRNRRLDIILDSK